MKTEFQGEGLCQNAPSLISSDRSENTSFQCQDSVVNMGCQVNDLSAETNIHEPLRLTGGGDNTFNSQESVNSDRHNIANNSGSPSIMNGISDVSFRGVDPENSISEHDVRDVLFEAGYTLETIDEIIATKAKSGLDDSSSTMTSVGSDTSRSESESVTECALDILKESGILTELL